MGLVHNQHRQVGTIFMILGSVDLLHVLGIVTLDFTRQTHAGIVLGIFGVSMA